MMNGQNRNGINPELIHALYGPGNPYRQESSQAQNAAAPVMRIPVDCMTLDWRDMMFLLNFVQTLMSSSIISSSSSRGDDNDDHPAPNPRKHQHQSSSLELCLLLDIVLLSDAAFNLLCNFLEDEKTPTPRGLAFNESFLQPAEAHMRHVMWVLLQNASIKS
jgi:hypothetical protein